MGKHGSKTHRRHGEIRVSLRRREIFWSAPINRAREVGNKSLVVQGSGPDWGIIGKLESEKNASSLPSKKGINPILRPVSRSVRNKKVAPTHNGKRMFLLVDHVKEAKNHT